MNYIAEFGSITHMNFAKWLDCINCFIMCGKKAGLFVNCNFLIRLFVKQNCYTFLMFFFVKMLILVSFKIYGQKNHKENYVNF
jgi:hypothetical protein